MSRADRPTVRLGPEHLRDHFAWDDPTIHRWSLRRVSSGPASSRLAEVVALPLLVAAVPLGVVCLPLWLLGRVAPAAAWWTAVVVLGFAVLLYLLTAAMGAARRTNVQWRDMAANRPVFPAVALGGLLVLVACPGSPLGAGFDLGGAEPSALLWLRYFGEHAASMLFLDLPRSLLGRFSPVSPASLGSLAAVVAFRVLFALGVVELLALSWRRHFRRRVFHATVRGAYVACVDPFGQRGVLRHLGVLEGFPEPETMSAAQLVVDLDQHLRQSRASRR